MTPKQVVDHFGSVNAVKDALNISYQAVAAWGDKGAVPVGRQCQIQIMTNGVLLASGKKAA